MPYNFLKTFEGMNAIVYPKCHISPTNSLKFSGFCSECGQEILSNASLQKYICLECKEDNLKDDDVYANSFASLNNLITFRTLTKSEKKDLNWAWSEIRKYNWRLIDNTSHFYTIDLQTAVDVVRQFCNFNLAKADMIVKQLVASEKLYEWTQGNYSAVNFEK